MGDIFEHKTWRESDICLPTTFLAYKIKLRQMYLTSIKQSISHINAKYTKYTKYTYGPKLIKETYFNMDDADTRILQYRLLRVSSPICNHYNSAIFCYERITNITTQYQLLHLFVTTTNSWMLPKVPYGKIGNLSF